MGAKISQAKVYDEATTPDSDSCAAKEKRLRDALFAAVTTEDITEIITKLVQEAKGDGVNGRIARRELLDRVLAKPTQAVTLDNDNGVPFLLHVVKTYPRKDGDGTAGS